ncbi:extracellular solute-binding protein [Ornithinibacillus californiensis]|uniref:extracellular solute-binding protein n=1 Tax=Ornithinibacillus californiensis TaxID=161536 RepID=UPI00064DE70C|nr:extracellular solute-binding protein [Ornithinibacillus californiensis]
MLKRVNSFEERYNRFLHELKDEILTGSIKPGEFILPENTLSKVYDLSRVSIRKALAELVEEGLIEKIPGKGNRVIVPLETSKQTLSLAWFSDSYEIEIVEQIIDRFEQLYPFVKINLELIPSSNYIYTLTQMIEHGHGPDVFMVSDYHFRELIESEQLDILDPFVPEHLEPVKDSYTKVFDMFSVGEKPLVTPFVFSPVVICYNKKMFKEANIPDSIQLQNWEDLLELARSSTKGATDNQIIDQYGFCFSSSSNRYPVFLLQNNGKYVLEDRSESVMDSSENIEALSFCVDLMYKHKVSPIFSHGSNELAEHLFMRERAAMILTTYYFMNEFRDHNISWDVLPVPANKTQATLLLGGALGINADSQMKETAKTFINYMVSTEAQTMLKRNGCTIPILRYVAEDNYLLQPGIHPDNYNAFKEVMPYAQTMRDLNITIEEMERVESELHFLWANMEKTEDVLKKIKLQMDDSLGK